MKVILYVTLAAMVSAMLAGPGLAQSGRARRVAPRPPASEPPPEVTPSAPAVRPAEVPSTADAGSTTQPAPPGMTIPVATTFDVRYQGGSLGLDQDKKVKVSVKDGRVGVDAKGASFSVVANQVTKITYAQRTRNRVAEGIGVGVLSPTAGGILGRSQSTAHFIEVLWEGNAPGGAVFRVGKDDYQGMLAALEAATGVKPHIEANPPVRDWQ
jgi:hypothetical protein